MSTCSGGLVFVRRSYHLYGYNPPKTHSARHTVELLPESVRVLRALQPLHVAPDTLVFTTTAGRPIEPKTLSEHWYKCLRALGLRPRGLCCTKDTYVTAALQAARDPRWVEKQTGLALATLETHYEKWMPDPARDELHQLGRAFGTVNVGGVQDVDPRIADVDPSVEIPLRNPMRGGGGESPRVRGFLESLPPWYPEFPRKYPEKWPSRALLFRGCTRPRRSRPGRGLTLYWTQSSASSRSRTRAARARYPPAVGCTTSNRGPW